MTNGRGDPGDARPGKNQDRSRSPTAPDLVIVSCKLLLSGLLARLEPDFLPVRATDADCCHKLQPSVHGRHHTRILCQSVKLSISPAELLRLLSAQLPPPSSPLPIAIGAATAPAGYNRNPRSIMWLLQCSAVSAGAPLPFVGKTSPRHVSHRKARVGDVACGP